MSSTSRRAAPPPVTATNPPRPPRQAPPAPQQPTAGNALAHTQTDPDESTTAATAFATNVGTNVGSTVPGGPGVPMSLTALMHGALDPEQDRAQTGVRLPKYVADAVRVVVATSRGKLTMQDVVTEAVKAYLPPEVLRQAWQQHGGN